MPTRGNQSCTPKKAIAVWNCRNDVSESVAAGVERDVIKAIAIVLCNRPQSFTLHRLIAIDVEENLDASSAISSHIIVLCWWVPRAKPSSELIAWLG
jgi:hypothetical protein